MNKRIYIDGVIFQIHNNVWGGIPRTWDRILTYLSKTKYADQITILSRGGTAPEYENIRTEVIPKFDVQYFERDAEDLGAILGNNLFMSTYYTTAYESRMCLMLHDMTPEMLGLDFNNVEWYMKLQAIHQANWYMSVSRNTEREFRLVHPQYADRKVFYVPNSVSEAFHARTETEIEAFKIAHSISKPYFIYVGYRTGFKNCIGFVHAFNMLPRDEYEILFVGGLPRLEPVLAKELEGAKYQVTTLTDDELSVAYAGAACLVYPSLREGFGLPILECLKSGGRVLTGKNSSQLEVGSDYCTYLDDNDTLMWTEEMEHYSKLEKSGMEFPDRSYTIERTGKAFTDALDEIKKEME